MKLELSAFSSKVARRVFSLFVIASAVPLAATAVLVLVQVKTLLETHAQEELLASARTLGQLALERLLIAAEVLPEVASGAVRNNPVFDAVVSLRDGEPTPVFGTLDIDLDALPAPNGERPVLSIDRQGAMIAETRDDGTVLVGHMSRAHLWSIADQLEFAADLCVFKGAVPTPVYCTAPVATSAAAALRGGSSAAASGDFKWSSSEGAMLSGYWELFTPSRFDGEPLKFVVTQPRAVALESLLAFDRVVPPVLLASIATVLLLSISQIRRSMRPLEQLLSWTRQLSDRRFTARLELDTHDEFQDLAVAMNEMADRLGQQFDALTMLAEVDRLILGSEGIERVVETILQRVARIVPGAQLGVLLLDADAPQKGSLYCYASRPTPRTDLHRIDVPPALQRTFAAEGVEAVVAGLLRGRNAAAGAARPLAAWAAPIAHGEHYFGALLVGRLEPVDELSEAASLTETADRIAVAISAKERERELVRQAHYDTLTKLPNRQLCYDRLHQALTAARRGGQRVAVLFIDLDGFKNVNDSLGHVAGDLVLREAAQRLSACVRDVDTVGRLGGDEYVVVLPSVSSPLLDATLERIMRSLAQPFRAGERELALTASIGITLFPEDGDSVPELLRRADTAMYSAKETGRNRYVYFASAMDSSAHERLALASDLHRALERGEFSLAYQPQIDLVSREIVGAEALLRWNSPSRDYVSPDRFVPVLEQLGLIGSVGAWTLDAAAAQLSSWRAHGLGLKRIAVNVSASQLLEPTFVALVEGALRKHGLDGDALEIELTERDFVEDFERSNAVLESLRGLGVQLSIDDFGTGYSSFGYMKDLVFDAVKIDKSFVAELPSERSVSIVRSIAAVAKTLDKIIVAEGIETAEQLVALRRLGCDIGQGYLVSKPLAAADFEAWLERHGAGKRSAPTFELPRDEGVESDAVLMEATGLVRGAGG